MLRVVAPVLQVLLVAWLDVSLTLSPWQIESGPPAVIVGGVDNALTTVTEALD